MRSRSNKVIGRNLFPMLLLVLFIGLALTLVLTVRAAGISDSLGALRETNSARPTTVGPNMDGASSLAISGSPYTTLSTPTPWSTTGSLATAREDHTATLLPNGKVLVAGGADSGGNPLDSAELYDPSTRKWSSTGSLKVARLAHTATLLPNGKVLVVGGLGSASKVNGIATAELYDSSTGIWSRTGDLNTGRVAHTATLLLDGRVLVTGGQNLFRLNSAELYDPSTGAWSGTGSLGAPRSFHTATLLTTGKVLVAGGSASNNGTVQTAELYDPSSRVWGGTGTLITGRESHSATLLPNGKVLIAGGLDLGSGLSLKLDSAELYDPTPGTWSSTGSLGTARYNHTATLLANGKVLVASGQNPSTLNSAELYDPARGNWNSAGSLTSDRTADSATLLPSGSVLVAAGFGSALLASAELYDPASSPTPITAFFGQVADPSGDAARYPGVPISPDIISSSITVTNGNLQLRVRFAPGTFNRQTTSVEFLLDTDQNPATGDPRQDPTIGADFFVIMGSAFYNGRALVYKYIGPPGAPVALVGSFPSSLARDGLDATIPLSAIGNDDGALNFKLACQAQIGPNVFTTFLDYAPDLGLRPGSTTGTNISPGCATDVTAQVSIASTGMNWIPFSTYLYSQTITVRNASSLPIPLPVFLVLDNLSCRTGEPVFLLGNQLLTYCNRPNGSYLLPLVGASGTQLMPGQTVGVSVVFSTQGFGGISYTPHVLSGMPSR